MSKDVAVRSSRKPDNPEFCPHHDPPVVPTIQNSAHPSSKVPLSRVEALQFLHRGEQSVVTIHRKPSSVWEDLGAIPVLDLEQRLPAIKQYLEADSYFLINSTFPRSHPTRQSPLTGLPIFSRRTDCLRWLNAVYVDLDPGHNGEHICFEDLRRSLLLAVAQRDLPTASLIVSSGRGLWALWRLADPSDRSKPVRAFGDKVELYRRVTRALARSFTYLNADLSSVDAARVMRMPESRNMAAHETCQTVHFYRECDEFVTLNDLASALDVSTQKAGFAVSANAHKDATKARAGLARWQRPLEGFERLWRMRGFFGKGVRHRAIYVYALLLRRNRESDDNILNRCRNLAASCNPELNESDIKRCISSSLRPASAPYKDSIRNAVIKRMLQITDAEAAELPEWFGTRRPRRSSKSARRRDLIKQELEQAGVFDSNRNKWISSRAMSRILSGKHGLRVSHVTVLEDYSKLQSKFFSEAVGTLGIAVNFRGS